MVGVGVAGGLEEVRSSVGAEEVLSTKTIDCSSISSLSRNAGLSTIAGSGLVELECIRWLLNTSAMGDPIGVR